MRRGYHWILWGAILSGVAVGMGAFAAHGLERSLRSRHGDTLYTKVTPPVPLAEKRLADFKTGANYQMYHGLGLVALGLVVSLNRPSAVFQTAGVCFCLGIAGFSGGLYGLVLFDQPLLGATIVPLGGVCFLIGWTCFAFGVLRAHD